MGGGTPYGRGMQGMHTGGGGSCGSITLSVGGLPADATRRELAHVFRQFAGYLSTEMSPSGGFVKFSSMALAASAMGKLRDYRFDEEQPGSPTLRLTFSQAR
ncbi:hypothetical protein T492DRAFT_1008458 [Pavlovales sp. CCMP2436]|nr:hypothetical protein T492DRAFT_1008458 [Pavlovales sp. CCMP2436]